MIKKSLLEELYLRKAFSVSKIALDLGCSQGKINYWLSRYKIEKRTISEAIYKKHNPNGDPFHFRAPHGEQEAKLFGLGIGLYWGEGNKANKNIVKLGNTDPSLLLVFIKFLTKFFKVRFSDFRFHLHLFSDIDTEEAIKFWKMKIGFKRKQLYKPYITQTGKLGTYRKKSKYGVLTVYFANTKLRNILVGLLSESY